MEPSLRQASLAKGAMGAVLLAMGLGDSSSDEEAERQRREQKWKFSRTNWGKDLEMLRHTKAFQSRYHMPEPSFNKLARILRPHLQVDEKQSSNASRGNGPITVEMIVGVGLRALGGPLMKDVAWH